MREDGRRRATEFAKGLYAAGDINAARGRGSITIIGQNLLDLAGNNGKMLRCRP